MPNFPVTEVPVQVSQTITQGALIRNVGDSTVYLDASSAVSPASFGVNLSPNDSVNWQPDLELWAVTDNGNTSALSVLYNATGTTLGNVTASIDGTVDVDLITPVNVQGGGEALLETSGSVPAGTTPTVQVPAPANGLTYYGLQIFVQATSGDTDGTMTVEVFNNDIAGANPPIEATVTTTTFGANFLGAFGTTNRAWFIVPLATSYPVTIRFNNPGATAVGYLLNVRGISQSLPIPIDAGTWEIGSFNPDQQISIANAAAGEFILFAPSFIDRTFNISCTNSISAGNLEIEGFGPVTGTFYISESLPHFAYYGGKVATTNMLEPFTKSRFVIPGNGRLHRLRVSGAITGIARVNYRGRELS